MLRCPDLAMMLELPTRVMITMRKMDNPSVKANEKWVR